MARNKTTKEKLQELYSTPEALTEAKSKYTTWAQMARAIGISKQSIYDYREYLGMPKETAGKSPNSFCLANQKETDDLIKQLMQGESKNVVTVYEIVSPIFYHDQRGYNGLKYARTEQGTSWAALKQQVSAVGGRGQ